MIYIKVLAYGMNLAFAILHKSEFWYAMEI
jgi:hypothetical protein